MLCSMLDDSLTYSGKETCALSYCTRGAVLFLKDLELRADNNATSVTISISSLRISLLMVLYPSVAFNSEALLSVVLD